MQLVPTFIKEIHPTWTLFLDRDGVINEELPGDYVKKPEAFVFYPGVPEALAILQQHFGRILIVTNQRGIGRGLMTHEDLHQVHGYMQQVLQEAGVYLHAMYYAPDLAGDAPDRKPNTGMGLKAKADFPDLDFTRSVMIGNHDSDMLFGKRLGMKTVFVTTTCEPSDAALPDLILPSLPAFASLF